jgi:hypothetical protein
MMTRDSYVWWAVMAAAVITGLPAHFDLLHKAIPVMPSWVDGLIELLAWAIGVVAAKMSMSPLPISQEGRTEAIQRNAVNAGAANVAANVAAVTADQAATATAKAADAADIAKTIAEKAADRP